MGEALKTVPAEAVAVLQKFLDASTQGDRAGMEACLTRQTLESGQFHGESPEGVVFSMGEPQLEQETVIIPVRAMPVGAPPDAPPVMEMPCMMVQEEGEWKFDLGATMDRMMGGSLGAAVEQIGSAMAQAVEGIGQAIADGLGQAFGAEDAGRETPGQNWDDASLEIGQDELLPMPEMVELPKTESLLTEAVGSQVLMLAAVPELLALVGSDDRDTLIDWYENALFTGWGAILAQVSQQVPLQGRLRAVRVEAAGDCDKRLLALDGSDLVYRMYLNSTDGYYSDSEIADLLPGVLAGLPEQVDPSIAGHRLLVRDDEQPDMQLYLERVVPRCMHRISQLIGRSVQLDEIAWEQAAVAEVAARHLQRWGLARVVGAVALACQDPVTEENLQRTLRRIHLELVDGVSSRSASFEEGTLRIILNPYSEERGGFYERDLARALSGEAVE